MFSALLPLITTVTLIGASFSAPTEQLLASHQISLDKRAMPGSEMNQVMKDNILLNIAYLSGQVSSKEQINWEQARQPFQASFRLEPGQSFAFHDDLKAEYKGKVVKTTNAHFNGSEGFKADSYIMGDGVCHLASLIYWAAKDAQLEAVAPTNHDFMPIPEINRVYGVAIYNEPGNSGVSANQNLYITNNKAHPVEFKFDFNGTDLNVAVVEID